MIIHLLIALLLAGTRISSADFQSTSQSTTPSMSIMGTWETERCVVQERDGIQTSSRSLFVFLAREWDQNRADRPPNLFTAIDRL